MALAHSRREWQARHALTKAGGGASGMQAESVATNIVAVVLYVLIWGVYELFFDGPLRRPDSLNARMVSVRVAWMSRILARENLIVDSSLIGHSIHTATFFASTTILILAGLLGVLGSSDRIYSAISSISMIVATDQRLFEWKIVLIILAFVHAFFRFTWAIRQFNYFCAIIGSAPRGGKAAETSCARSMAAVLSHAVANVNAGFRAYYFAFGAVGWIFHPLALVLGALLTVAALVRRQLYSRTARAIRDYANVLDGTGP
jgi:uncharacterized membrane protein